MAHLKCSVVECSRELVARGLCELHYRRLKNHGTIENTRPSDWGKRESHPLYQSWRWLIRKRSPMCQEWQKDFWLFAKNVGDRPGDSFKLWRLKDDQPYGPDNFFWRESSFKKESTESEKEYRRRYMREWAKVNPEKVRNLDLKKHYGVTLKQYNEMLKAQNGVCAICGKINDIIDKRTGKVRELSVDHCHTKGHVRKLLCQYCNQGLGNFKDDPSLLRAAANYLDGYETTAALELSNAKWSEIENGSKTHCEPTRSIQEQWERMSRSERFSYLASKIIEKENH